MVKLTNDTAVRGTIIQDEVDGKLYLILEHSKERKFLRCLDEKFDEVRIGTDWINNYYVNGTIDMDVFVKMIS